MSETAKPMPEVKRRKVPGTYITSSDAAAASARFVTSSNGEKYVVRFSWMQRFEHLLLVITVTALAITGFSQTYYSTRVGASVLTALGGIDSTRQVHHIFAFLLILQVLYHLGNFLRDLFTQTQFDKVWFGEKDLSQLFQTLGYNLGLSKSRPRFDRFSFEQKLHYWIFLLGVLVLAGSGLMQLFPIITARYLPGWIIPIARAFHHWQAILTVSLLLTWHFYQNVLKGVNRSIFSGLLSVEEMQREHPAELLYLERAAAQINNTKWPRFISLATEEQPAAELKPEPIAEELPESEPEQDLDALQVAEVGADDPQADLTEAASSPNMSEDDQNG